MKPKHLVNGLGYLYVHHESCIRENINPSRLIQVNRKQENESKWRCSVVVIAATQLRSTNTELGLCAGSNPARGESEICDGENLLQWSWLEIRRKRLSSVNHATKTIHDHNNQRVLK